MRNFIRSCGSGIFAALLLSFSSAMAQADTSVAAQLSPQEAAALQSTHKAIIVDVREDSEWQEQHIPGALHIPLSQLAGRMGELDKHSTIITQCRSGKRSTAAQTSLKAAGFSDVYNLEGGIMAWQQQGLSIE